MTPRNLLGTIWMRTFAMISASEDTLIDDETLYLHRVDQTLLALASAGSRSLDSFVDGALGADPFVVSERLRTLGVCLTYDMRTTSADDGGRDWTPELHPLDFEWYFTAPAALELARTALSLGTDLVCLGAPTVAYAAAPLLAKPSSLLLVDRTPFARRRAPGNARHFDFREHDLDAPLILDRTFSVAVFDAPWYPKHLSSWLTQAVRLVRPGGHVLFPLLGELHRPTAPRDRTRLLDEASTFGRIKTYPSAVLYESPLFERLSLRRHGLHVSTHWRKADLVVLHISGSRRPLEPPPRPPAGERWDTFVIGPQVVKLRRRVPDPGPLSLSPICGCQDFDYDGISTSDPRRSMIDLWSSRNRVARLTRTDLLRRILSLVAEGHGVSEAVARILADHTLDHREALLRALDHILDATDPQGPPR